MSEPHKIPGAAPARALRQWPLRLNWGHRPPPPSKPPSFTDLWARSTLRQRRWEVLLLAINLLGYVLLNAQFYYVHQAVYFDFSWDSYVATVNRTLLDFLLKPINVTQVPMMIPVLGSLLGAMIVIPILVAQFYRWWAAFPFLLVVLLVGHLPVMSFYLYFACLAVGLPQLRLTFSYANTLIALLIMTVYVVIATHNPGDIVVQLSRPTDIFLLFAPWVFAIIAAALAAGLVLILARWLRKQPGVVSGMLILPFMLPTILFGRFIGHDELQYRLLEGQYGPGSLLASMGLDEKRLRQLGRDEVTGQVRESLARTQLEIQATGEAFIQDYRTSRHVPSVLFLIARAWDMNPDWTQWQEMRTLDVYDDFPAPASRKWWRKLVEDHGHTVFGLVARQRLAQFFVRDGDLDRAIRLLREALQLYNDGTIRPPPRPERSTLAGLLKADPPTDMLNLDLESQSREIEDMLVLLEQNRRESNSNYATEPIVLWFKLDPHHPDYARNLQYLCATYPASRLRDNAGLALAMHLPPQERGRRLEELAGQAETTDGGRQALLLLGEWYQHRADARGDRQVFLQAQKVYDRLISRWPESSQAQKALAASRKMRNEFSPAGVSGKIE